jgi:hypothetical protein
MALLSNNSSFYQIGCTSQTSHNALLMLFCTECTPHNVCGKKELTTMPCSVAIAPLSVQVQSCPPALTTMQITAAVNAEQLWNKEKDAISVVLFSNYDTHLDNTESTLQVSVHTHRSHSNTPPSS